MSQFWIYVDASCNALDRFFDADRTKMLPMECFAGTEVIRIHGPQDEESIERFKKAQADAKVIKTSQISPAEYENAFVPVLEAGESILYLSLSSQLSSTYQTAAQVAQRLNASYEAKVHVFDSRTATAGIGLLADDALRLREEGHTIEEVIQKLEEQRPHLGQWYIVGDLNYLFRGGRLSRTSALLGTALRIKPILSISEEGKLYGFDKVRGQKQAEQKLFSRYKEHHMLQSHVIVLGYTGQDERVLEMAERIRLEDPQAHVEVQALTPIIAAHTGPDLLGLFFYEK